MKPRRIRRFPRRPSDAHLLTPPDTKLFRYVLDCSGNRLHKWQSLIDDLVTNGLITGPLTLKDLTVVALRSGTFDDLETYEEEGGFIRYALITRRPKLSQKLLSNLPPLQRQRMRQRRKHHV